LTPRVFDLVRKALSDPAPAVVDAALQLLRKTNFVGALSPLTRYSANRATSACGSPCSTASASTGIHWGRRASCSKWRARRRAPSGKPRRRSWRGWPSRGREEVVTLLGQARDAEEGEPREALDRMLTPAARA
jgi:hypothetical protein